jgi:hypothetical protein
MGRNASFFAAPDEVAELVERCCDEHGWNLWLFPESTATGPIRRLRHLDEAGQRQMVWVGAVADDRVEWNTRDAVDESGFACVVRPTLVSSPGGPELTLTEVFSAATSHLGRLAPFNRLKAALSALAVGKVCAVSDYGDGSKLSRIRYTQAAAGMWRSGVILRQVPGGHVHFVPNEAIA